MLKTGGICVRKSDFCDKLVKSLYPKIKKQPYVKNWRFRSRSFGKNPFEVH